MTLNLWRAEWLKTCKRPLNRAMLGSMLAMLIVLLVGLIGMTLVNPARFLDLATSWLPFPRTLDLSVDLLKNLGGLLVVVFMANSAGSEYSRDTWKVILPRYGSRPAFLVTKWVVGLVALLLLVASMLVIALIGGWVGALILDLKVDPGDATETATHLRNLGVTLLDFVFLGTLTLFGAIATRSTIGAALFGILTYALLALLQVGLPLVLTGAPLMLPTAHVDNLHYRWVLVDPQADARMAALFNRSVPPWVSALVVIGYIGLLLGATLYLFQRRDMAGE